MSFLSVFSKVLHGIESASQIAAPIIATQDPTVGAIMQMAVTAAVGVEAAITADGTGAQRAAVVAAQSQAVIDVANAILSSQNKKPLPANTNEITQALVKTVVTGMNAVEVAVKSSKIPVLASTLPAPLVGK